MPDPDPAPALRELHHITRIDIEPTERYPRRHATHGWQVRARRMGNRISKFFADSRHGGSAGALDAAKAYRDSLLDALPEPDSVPRKAWSNTGVVGLSVREKDEAGRRKLYVQLNWMAADGRRRASSFSVEKWGLRRALWNGCLKLYRERTQAGTPVEEPHVMFARAQEPFQALILVEIAAEQLERGVAVERVRETEEVWSAEPVVDPVSARADALEREEDAIRRLEDALFG
jgi:hypothetical protein